MFYLLTKKYLLFHDFLECPKDYFYIAHGDAINFLKKGRIRDKSRKTGNLEFVSAVKEGKKSTSRIPRQEIC